MSHSKADRTPTLPEKMEIIDMWFAGCAKVKLYKQADAPIKTIAELLMQKGLVSDKDTGVKHILKSLNIRESDAEMKLDYALF